MGRVDYAWADALLAGAENTEEAAAFEAMLDGITQAMAESGDLRELLLNPRIPGEAKKETLCALTPAGTPAYGLNFLRLLVDKRHAALIPTISGELKHLRAARADDIEIVLTSAQALDAAETDRVRDAFVKRYGAAGARITQQIDPSLIGGVRVQVGDDLFDQSIAGRMAGLARVLHNEAE